MTRGRTKPLITPVQRNLLNVSGMHGAHLQYSEVDAMPFNQPIAFIAKNDAHALKLKDELAEWLITEEPAELQFDDEPGRTYYAIVQNTIEDFERIGIMRQGSISFLCLDPYAYGEEDAKEFTSDTVIINNPGTAPADPIIELEVEESTTFAMVQNQNQEYMMIGTPIEDDVEVVNGKELILSENGSTLDTWNSAGTRIDDWIGNISGKMRYDGTGILAESYGTGEKMHGPAVIKEIPPIQDFEIDTTFDIISNFEIDNYRMEIYMFDEGMDMLGKMGVNDNNRNLWRRNGLGRVGEYVDNSTRYVIGGGNYQQDDLKKVSLMYLRVKREGKKVTFYIAEIRNGRHHATLTRSMNVSSDYLGKLKYVQLFIGNWKDRNRTFRTRINYVNVYELAQNTVDNTPYILYPGDIVTFDHVNEEILVNGEDRKDLKDFGGSFFSLTKGENQLIMHPANSFFGNVKFRPRYR